MQESSMRLASRGAALILFSLSLPAQVQWVAPGSATNAVAVNFAGRQVCRVVAGSDTYAGTIVNPPFCTYVGNGANQSASSGYTVAVGLGKWEASGLAAASPLGSLNGLPTRVCRAKVDGTYLAGHTSVTLPVSCQIAGPSGTLSLSPYEQLYDFVSTGEFQIRNQELCLSARIGQTPAVQVRTCSDQTGDQWRIQAAAGGNVRLESVAQAGQCLYRDGLSNNVALIACASATPLRQLWFTDTAYRFADLATGLFLGRAEGLTSGAGLLFRGSTGSQAEAFEVLTLSEASRRLSVTSYNIMMLPGIAFPYLQQHARADYIPPAIDRLGLLADVLTFQEGFQNSARIRLLTHLQVNYGYSWFTGVPDHSAALYESAGFLDGTLTNGGMFIASRWPVERTAYHKFNWKSQDGLLDTTGADALAAKGVTYARVLKLGRRYHIFTTHLQAGPPWDEAAVRQQQLREMKTFAGLQLATASADDGVIFTGDFNIDMELDVGNYYFLTDALQADFIDAPRPIGISYSSHPLRWSVDPTINDISSKRGASFQWLDYSFIGRSGAKVTRSAYQMHQPENSFPYIMEIKNTAELPWGQDPFLTKDVSDHGALFAKYVFAPAANVVAPADLVNVEFRTMYLSNPVPEGQLKLDGGAISTPQTLTLERNKPVQLEAFPTLAAAPGYRFCFDGWDAGTAPSFTFTPTADTRVNAMYRQQAQLKANINPPDAGTVTGEGYYDDDQIFTLVATAKPGFAFLNYGAPFNRTQSTVTGDMPSSPLTFPVNFVATGAPRLSLLTAGPRTYSTDGNTVRVPLRMSNNGTGGAINARIIAIRNIVVTSGSGAVQFQGAAIPGFGTIPAGVVGSAIAEAPLLWPASASRIRAEFVLAADGGYQTTVTLNLIR